MLAEGLRFHNFQMTTSPHLLVSLSYIIISILYIDSGVCDSSKMDYKSAKEAFVADNPGTSIWTVNAVSLVGLVSSAA
jgi:hypothetical protein